VKYIIGSGWWCATENGVNNITEKRVLFGDDEIRGKAFHHLWYQSICENTTPDKIVIVDSCSPAKPELCSTDERLEFVSLNENAGHSTDHKGKYSGWMRSVLHGISYANCCDCDYFVYVEQDALLKGQGIIEFEISQMKKNYAFGASGNFIQPLQQSFFIIHHTVFEKFLSRSFNIKARDNLISPERKFAIASSALLSILPEFLFYQPSSKKLLGKVLLRIQNIVLKTLGGFGYLKSGYGRNKPINFNDDYFYFQHGEQAEIRRYLNK